MATINLLSKDTIDKIAAGEVVERPASVVKELVENAVDAGADAVTVEIKDGGISFIRVTDNGCGIEKSEVPRAFLRHATSKIRSAEDLSGIMSLGFRGEALSSIAAVSQLELVTKTKEELTGLRFRLDGGEEKETEEVGAPDGTTLIVRNLFFNTPARRKFLKQPQTEGGYVSELMEHMALSNPQVSFQYINNGRVRFHTSGNGELREVIYRIYGRDIAAALIPVDEEENGIHMYGFLGKPEINRSNRGFELYFVNGRFIKSAVIGKAIEEGYRRYVMQHKFPFAVLHFRIHSEEVDVNVHPSKMEVRFTSQALLHQFISVHIAAALHRTELIPEITLVKETERSGGSGRIDSLPEPFEVNRREKEYGMVREEPVYTAAQKTAAQEEKAVPHTASREEEFFVESGKDGVFRPEEEKAASEAEKKPEMKDLMQSRSSFRIFGTEKRSESAENAKNHANIIKANEHIFVEKPVQMNLFEEKILTREARAEYRILGQIFDTYWLVTFRDRLFIIDQHAAHEKVKYEKFMRELKDKAVVSQMVDPPIILSLSGREESVLAGCLDTFAQMGFEIDSFGGKEYAIRSVPADLYGCLEGELFIEILDSLSDGPSGGAPSVIENRIATMACKAAVKGNMPLDGKEIEALIDQLLSLEDPYHCPHGRPTIISMSRQELEKKFKRII